MKIFSGNKLKIFLHLLAWSILLGLPLYFINRWEISKEFAWLYYINISINGSIFYLNYFLLVPNFFYLKKRIKYFLFVLLMIGSFYVVSDLSNKHFFQKEGVKNGIEQVNPESINPNPPFHPSVAVERKKPPYRQIHFFNFIVTSMFLVFFSLGLRVIERNTQIEKIQKEMEKEKLNAELAFLKNQISPHFFFNTLNNIYSLISINAEDSQKAVLKLSKLMRYLLYESEHGNTLLSNEIEFMNNYIDLMKLRISDKVSIELDFPKDFADTTIPPLLFIPFIENAFKHGISYREKSFVHIKLKKGIDSIEFNCFNSISTVKSSTDTEHSGIGLHNVKKRLNLLFHNKYTLDIFEKKDVYKVNLIINIKV